MDVEHSEEDWYLPPLVGACPFFDDWRKVYGQPDVNERINALRGLE